MTSVTTLRERYCAAQNFDAFLAAAETNRDLWHAVARRASVPENLAERARQASGKWHLLVLAADWCGDAINVLPFIASLADATPNLDLRVLERDENLDLMDQHLTGQSLSIPVVILLDENFTERAWWGPRPRELQEWILGPGRSMTAEDRYRYVRRWYVQDRGVTALTDIVDLIENALSEDLAA